MPTEQARVACSLLLQDALERLNSEFFRSPITFGRFSSDVRARKSELILLQNWLQIPG